MEKFISEDCNDSTLSVFNYKKRYYVNNDALSELNTEIKKKLRKEIYNLEDFYISSKRLETFQSWSRFHPIKPEQLVQAGFCYTGLGDTCICPWCEKEVDRWSVLDEPFSKHKAISSSLCTYLGYIFPEVGLRRELINSSKNLFVNNGDTEL